MSITTTIPESYLSTYRRLPFHQQLWLRDTARRELLKEGHQDISGADVSFRVYDMYLHHGSFDAVFDVLIKAAI